MTDYQAQAKQFLAGCIIEIMFNLVIVMCLIQEKEVLQKTT